MYLEGRRGGGYGLSIKKVVVQASQAKDVDTYS
jgi:hypothetical protein